MLTDGLTMDRIEKRRTDVIAGIESEVRERMKDLPSCHDWWHIMRVRKLGRHLALAEGADVYIVDLALLLHDVADHKFTNNACLTPSDVARDIMDRHKVLQLVKERIAKERGFTL